MSPALSLTYLWISFASTFCMQASSPAAVTFIPHPKDFAIVEKPVVLEVIAVGATPESAAMADTMGLEGWA